MHGAWCRIGACILCSAKCALKPIRESAHGRGSSAADTEPVKPTDIQLWRACGSLIDKSIRRSLQRVASEIEESAVMKTFTTTPNCRTGSFIHLLAVYSYISQRASQLVTLTFQRKHSPHTVAPFSSCHDKQDVNTAFVGAILPARSITDFLNHLVVWT